MIGEEELQQKNQVEERTEEVGAGDHRRVKRRAKRNEKSKYYCELFNNRCPKCGLEITHIQERHYNNNTYLYAYHNINIEERKVTKACYLGPSTYYKHANLISDIIPSLTTIKEEDVLLTTIKELINTYIRLNQAKKEDIERLTEGLIQMIESIKTQTVN